MTEEDYILVSNLRAILDALAVLDRSPPYLPFVEESVTAARRLLDTAQTALFAKVQCSREKISQYAQAEGRLHRTPEAS